MSDRFQSAIEDYETACNRMVEVMNEAKRVLEEYSETVKWLRFDTVIGPLIGGCVIVGVIVIAAVCGYLQ